MTITNEDGTTVEVVVDPPTPEPVEPESPAVAVVVIEDDQAQETVSSVDADLITRLTHAEDLIIANSGIIADLDERVIILEGRTDTAIDIANESLDRANEAVVVEDAVIEEEVSETDPIAPKSSGTHPWFRSRAEWAERRRNK